MRSGVVLLVVALMAGCAPEPVTLGPSGGLRLPTPTPTPTSPHPTATEPGATASPFATTSVALQVVA